jgi:hypothetical protein
VVGDLSTAHPSIMADGTLVNFTRSLPKGGFHVYKQDPHTLKRTEVRSESAGEFTSCRFSCRLWLHVSLIEALCTCRIRDWSAMAWR